jgi:large subunit ribosomal protein L29
MAGILELNDEQLVHRFLERERELVSSRFRHATSQLENTASMRVVRKDLARILTELRARERANGSAKGSLMDRHRRSFQASGAAAPAASGGFLQGIVDKLSAQE